MKSFILCVLTLMSFHAFAYNVETKTGSQIYLSIPKEGATVQFSDPVKAISGGKNFRIQSIGSDTDEKTQRELNPQVFTVTALNPLAEETVVFVFGAKESNARMLSVRFKAKEQGPSFFNIRLVNESKDGSLKNFMPQEIKLMRAMIKDEDFFQREIVSEALSLKGFDGVDFNLTRRFESNGLKGFVFEIKNTSRSKVTVQLDALMFGNTRPAMAHADLEELDACPLLFKSSDDKPCTTLLHLIVRDGGDVKSLNQKFPFIKNL